MTAVAFAVSEAGIPSLRRAVPAVAFDELCRRLFADLPRRDQRRTGVDYIWALLQSDGRTSMRELAALPGVNANGQSLHHFITNSSWDWSPVRRALAAQVLPALLPAVWVVQAFPAPPRTSRSVPGPGPVPPALGVWAAGRVASVPVGWSLPVPGETRSLGRALAETLLGPVRDWGLPPLPAVLDARGAAPASLIAALRAHGVPVLMRIDGEVGVRCALAGRASQSGPALPMTARSLADLARNRRRPVHWHPAGASEPRTALVWADRVRLTGREAERDLVLMSVSDSVSREPSRLWLTDLAGARTDALFRLTALLDRVAKESDRLGERFGLRAFAGRKPEAWHRHATLAAAAYALTELGRVPEARAPGRPVPPQRTGSPAAPRRPLGAPHSGRSLT